MESFHQTLGPHAMGRDLVELMNCNMLKCFPWFKTWIIKSTLIKPPLYKISARMFSHSKFKVNLSGLFSIEYNILLRNSHIIWGSMCYILIYLFHETIQIPSWNSNLLCYEPIQMQTFQWKSWNWSKLSNSNNKVHLSFIDFKKLFRSLLP